MLNNHLILHLTLLDGIGYTAIQRIMQSQRSDVSASDLYLLSQSQWMNYFGLSENSAAKIAAGLADEQILEKELILIEQHKIKWITILDEAYPALLREIYSPPPVLYYLGSDFHPSILFEDKKLRANGDGNNSFSARPECAEGVYRRVVSDKCIAVVGSRKATGYGQRAVDTLVPDLVAAGYTIVSGGALGVDTMAHEAALKCGGKTVAIFGSGLLKPYPSHNKSLFKRIVDNGGIVASSYPLTMEPFPHNFPARNRIITGLSRGCLVVQAAQKSGALISAHCAMEQGREVFAVPGNFDDELSAGCNEIIQQGAKLVSNSADILQEFGDRIIVHDIQAMQHKAMQLHIESTVIPAKKSEHVENENYSEAQKNIIRVCKQPTSLDDIIIATQLSMASVQSELFNLQLDGVVSQDFTGMWVAL